MMFIIMIVAAPQIATDNKDDNKSSFVGLMNHNVKAIHLPAIVLLSIAPHPQPIFLKP